MNSVVLIGNMTKDPELRRTQTGKAVTSFTLAVSRQFSNANGEKETDFINCVVWGKSAENTEQYCHKGSKVCVQGSIQTRNFEGNDGRKVYVTEVLCNNVEFLNTKSQDQKPVDTGRPNVDDGFNNDFDNSLDNSFDIMDEDVQF